MQERWPGSFGRETDDETSIDQVKGVIGKVERFQSVHNPKAGVFKMLHPGIRAGVIDHLLADIDACHIDMGICKGYILHPTARPTTDIQNIMDIGEVVRALDE